MPTRPARLRVTRTPLVLGATVLALLSACSSSPTASTAGTTPATEAPATSTPPPLTFYRPSTVLASGTPGEVISHSPIALASDLPATGERITYVSTTPAGDLVPVTGVLMTPLVPAPAGGYPVAVWAHGTTGLGDECAPSNFAPFSLAGAAPLLDAGVVVVAPDYEGLGTDEIHPYLVGEASGHNVLDAARAAATVGGNTTVVAWGHSQGGHAVLFARDLAASYAPELDLRGVAAAAPVTDPAVFLVPGTKDPNVFPFLAEALIAWSTVYEEPLLTDLVDEEAAQKARLLGQACTGDIAELAVTDPQSAFRSDPQNAATWIEAVRVNTAVAGTSTVPVLLTHGEADTLVPIAGTEALAHDLCEADVPTTLLHDPTWNHTTAWAAPLAEIDTWLLARLAGDPAPTDCPIPAPTTTPSADSTTVTATSATPTASTSASASANPAASASAAVSTQAR